MVNRSKQKGTRFESELVEFAHAHGFPHARRLVLSGAKDKGDLCLGDDVPVTIEAKNCAAMDLGSWMGEAEREAITAGTYRFAVVHNRRSKAMRDNYATVPVWFLLELLGAWRDQRAADVEGAA